MSHILEVRGLQVAFQGNAEIPLAQTGLIFLWIRERRSVWSGSPAVRKKYYISGCYGAFGPGRPCVTGRNPF